MSIHPILFRRILQLQQLIVDVQSKLNHEQKEREVDQHGLSTRYSFTRFLK